ncbi:hypothetical protein AMTRI_Chr09g32840 [Amborella trichopoda]
MAAVVDVEIGGVEMPIKKRKLPLWMLGVTAADKIRDTTRESEDLLPDKEIELEQASELIAKPASKRKRPDKKLVTREADDSDLEVGCLVRCKKRSRAQKSRKDDTESDDLRGNGEKIKPEKKSRKRSCTVKRTVREPVHSKNRSSEDFERERSGVAEGLSSAGDNGNGVELTMEDLISMAEEYVKADAEKENKPIVKNPSICNQKNQKPAEKESFPYKSQMPLGPGSGTDDTTDEMLGLFLGPLLPKPPDRDRDRERKLEEFEEELTMACYEFSKKVNKETEREEEPLTKKKSSLKDKVSLFLN